MKKYVLSSILLVMFSVMANFAIAQSKCTATCGTTQDCKPNPDCCVCTKECSEETHLAGKAWEGEVIIDGKAYKASGRIFANEKGSYALLNVSQLKMVNAEFAVTRDKKNRYRFTWVNKC